ncbi:hypothetical protein GGI25_005470 [Coemansia spiralis]|uniref:Peregrin n=1 Tax=Coemansia spiralis TaxID=417178 RepID=A0A9W8G283_9FUNG|nr:hypothetical protein GGI25_005470 [Coemansia spiralis]
MGPMSSRDVTRALVSSSEEEDREEIRLDKHTNGHTHRSSEGAGSDIGTAKQRRPSRAASPRARRSVVDGSSDVNMSSQPMVDSADEGDEEFVHSESDEDLEDSQGYLSNNGGRRVSMRRGRIAREQTSMRLRKGLRSQQTDASDALSVSERITRRHLRRGSRRATGGFDVGSVDQKGYASSPTTGSRRLRRGHADSLHSSLRNQVPDSLETDASNSDECLTMGIDAQRAAASPGSTASRRALRRRIVPSLVTTADNEMLDTPTRSLSLQQLSLIDAPMSPPPIVDKPREERSYKEFFPDLNVFVPLSVQFHSSSATTPHAQSQQATPTEAVTVDLAGDLALSSAPLSEASPPDTGGQQAERQPSRSSSGLSIKLIFNDPHSRPAPTLGGDAFRSQPQRLGKSPLSYAGTPQSSVVVLAPKRPVLTLPETRYRPLHGKDAQPGYRPAEFRRPEGHYIRNVELTEKDLATRIEYDLDDIDRVWLERLNQSGGAEVSANTLELVVDHIEKEWFELVKEAQRAISLMQQEQLPAEESACAICGEEECDNTNAIVFCDGCNLAVHQDCYGVPYIPEGQWLCRSCMLSPDKEVACILCPQRGGAFKKTTTNKWAHLLCALWIPEAGIANTVYMEPIDSIDAIPRSRWRLYCHLCHRKVGACIQCSHRQCFAAFHATCARRARLSMSVKPSRSGEPVFRAYCERHTPAAHAAAIDLAAPLKHLGRKGATAAMSVLSSDLVSMLGGTARPGRWPPTAVELLSAPSEDTRELFAQATGDQLRQSGASLQLTMRIFNPDRPVLNEHVFARVLPARLGASRARIIEQVARYWALKRISRHGAPLLKRLHLEPWTASVTQQRAVEMAEEQRQGFVRRLRTDLERVRLLVESVRRREREKLRSARHLVAYLQLAVDPLTPILSDVVDDLLRRDPRGVLSHPVSREEAPDYFDIIAEPMDLGTVRDKVRAHQYGSVGELERDLGLVVRNCMVYNKPSTYYYQLATRIKRHVERLVREARAREAQLPIDPASGRLLVDADLGIFDLDGRVPAAAEAAECTVDKAKPAAAAAAAADKAEAGRGGAAAAEPRVTRSQRARPTRTSGADAAARSASGAGASATPAKRKATDKGAAAAPSPRKRPNSAQPKRRLTLFEQLSVPPPDVRGSPLAANPNVLTTRLRPTGAPAKKKFSGTLPTAAATREDSSAFAPGTPVWAKMPSFPWFPAEICDATDSAALDKPHDANTLVRFFSATQSQWRWVNDRQVCRLGSDRSLDEMFYRAKGAKSSNMVRSVRLAYVEACRANGIEPVATPQPRPPAQ